MADSNLTPDFVARGQISRGCWAPELSGKVAIVTGAGRLRGIGRMTALEFARQGVHVIVTGTGRPPSRYTSDEQEVGWKDVESVAAEVEACGVRSEPVVLDISDEDAVAALISNTVDRYGRVDIVVNNASAARGPDRKPVLELDAATWRNVLNINATGTFLMSQRAARRMVEQGEGGSIINISSIASKVPMKNIAAYASSKAAVDMFSRSLAQELAPHGIRVNSINPGAVETARLDDIGRGERWEAARTSSPLGWASDGLDIAYMCVYLASAMGAWITGQAINVDGGRAS
jgi:3-oxoacyl-[acyl-carrier protein] reductase/meso-butanediol dehydrogenase/(S,S)-butanediol dehydrogenase/diacetyl reductase